MRSFLVVLAGFAVAFAQNLQNLPECSKGCLGTSLPQQCKLTDFNCICSDKSFLDGLSCCISTACNQADQDATIKFAQQICKVGNVDIGSTSLGCAKGTAAPSGSSSSAPATSAAVTSGASSATNAPTSSGAISSAISSITSSVGNAAASSATTARPSSTGAAAHFGQGFGAVGAAVAAFALL